MGGNLKMAEKNNQPQKVKVYRHNQTKKTGTGVETSRGEWEWGHETIQQKKNAGTLKPRS